MIRSLLSFALALSILISAGVAQGDIIYQINHAFPVTGGTAGSTTLTVNGTITTDGTLGSILPGQLTDWAITFESDNLGSQTVVPSGPSLWSFYNGLGFRATATELYMDEATGLQQRIELQSSVDGQWDWGDMPGGSIENTLTVQLSASGNDDVHSSGPYVSEFLFATVVPEPSSAILLIFGSAGILACRRKAR